MRVFYLYSRVPVPPKWAWISDNTLSTYFNYHRKNNCDVRPSAEAYLWSDGAGFAHEARDTLVFIQKQGNKCFI